MSDRYAAVSRVLLRVLVLNLAVALAKIALGLATGSVSVLSDGYHSLTDGASNVVALVGVRIASRPPDVDHPYGHRKFETMASLGILLFLLLVLIQVVRAAAGRLVSLDVFRGITVAGMILANNMGGPSYAPFHHAHWDGWTPTDLIFPSFLFIVGVSITFSLTKRRESNAGLGPVVGKIVRRSAIIFAVGLLLSKTPPASTRVIL